MAEEVSIHDLEQAIEQGVYVLDVREPHEFSDGHVPEARLVPLNSVSENLDSIPKDEKIWVICQAGGRSMTAANFLIEQGFDAVSVAGGTGSWIASGKEVSFEESK